MRAIYFEKYGEPQKVLEIRELRKPVPKENEVLIKIMATTINDYDWSLVRGKPWIYRIMFGFKKPKNPIPGMELSGIIEEVGAQAKNFKVGDAVFGDISGYGFGSFASHICIDERAVVHKPDEMSFEEAATLPHAALLAYQGLVEKGKIQSGQKVLINGAGGGVGSIALQIAKGYGCEVTGVDSGKKFNLMKSIGFDFTIDYTKEDFTRNGLTYDLILDCKSNRSAFSLYKSLAPKGRYITIGGDLSSLLNILVVGKLVSLFSTKKLEILSLKPNAGLQIINELFIKGEIKSVIDGPYPFEEIPALIEYFGRGEHLGKIVVRPQTEGSDRV